MFTAKQIEILNLALTSYLAVLQRKINAEKNPAIKDLLAKDYNDVVDTRMLSNDPKLLKVIK